MTEKKKPEFEEELEENQAEAVATTETGSSEVEQISAELATLKKQLADAESKASDYKDSC